MKIFLITLFFSWSLIGCKENQDEVIILTNSFSENPDTPRIGIEVRSMELYFCKENIEKKGDYDFYYRKLDPSFFKKYKHQIEEKFKNIDQSDKIVDATLYELIFRFRTKSDTLRFYKSFLTKEQNEVIEEIIALKNRKLQKINYHEFPDELLKYRLPTPPSEKINDHTGVDLQ